MLPVAGAAPVPPGQAWCSPGSGNRSGNDEPRGAAQAALGRDPPSHSAGITTVGAAGGKSHDKFQISSSARVGSEGCSGRDHPGSDRSITDSAACAVGRSLAAARAPTRFVLCLSGN